MMEPNQVEAAAKPQQPQRKLSQKRAVPERPDRHTKKGRLEPLDTEDIPQEAASPADEQALSTGAVKPETPAKVSRTQHTLISPTRSPTDVQAPSISAMKPETLARVWPCHVDVFC